MAARHSSPPPALSQAAAAQKMYSARASSYEQSWHPSYSARLMRDVVRAQPCDSVLVLACGTGLEDFIAAHDVRALPSAPAFPGGGDSGSRCGAGRVIGVDVTLAMLAEARRRLFAEQEEGRLGKGVLEFVEHDITDLDSCAALKGMEGGFDVLVCSCAFVLLEDLASVVRGWRKWLYNANPTRASSSLLRGADSRRPPGRLIIDITHENNMVQGTVIEAAARELGVAFPSSRLWIKDRESLRGILEPEGYIVERIELIENVAGDGVTFYSVDDAEAQFDYVTGGTGTRFVWEGVDMTRARALFKEKWTNRSVNGRIEAVDGLYVYVARLRPDIKQ